MAAPVYSVSRDLICLSESLFCVCGNYGFICFFQGERATGYGVALLNTLFGSYSANPILQAVAPQLTIDETDQPPTKRPKLA